LNFSHKEETMRKGLTEDGLTVRVIAGTHCNIIGIDLDPSRQKSCLGFSIQRTDLGPRGATLPLSQQQSHWLPNLLQFPKDTSDLKQNTTQTSPLQSFRWGDWVATPGHTYHFKVIAQYGQWNQLAAGPTVELDVTTESAQLPSDPASPSAAVFFNRGAAASEAYQQFFGKYGNIEPDKLPDGVRQQAFAWLSRGLEEAILAFQNQAMDSHFALHAAIYEFQKVNLLQGLEAAIQRGAEVKVVYHARPGGSTAVDNAAAAHQAGLDAVCHQRTASPTNAISHNKFVVLLKDNTPLAVWTGSTNWTDGGIYGQLNVGHTVYDPQVAQKYESYFELLYANSGYKPLQTSLSQLTPVPQVGKGLDGLPVLPPDVIAGQGIWPIFSPQPDLSMLDLYAAICHKARHLLVSAPFELAQPILDTFQNVPAGTLHFLLVDKTGSLGNAQEVSVIEGKLGNEVSVATTLNSPLHNFQNHLLEGKESFHHAGIHIHSKIIACDPLSDDPIIVTGSANFSTNSTHDNDENSLIIRGDTRVADIYTTEFMRMFEHYLFRGKSVQSQVAKNPLGLKEDDSWLAPFFVPGSYKAMARQLFAGTVA
jgi:hypothetical protein